jgi:predicted nucleotidyltransferase
MTQVELARRLDVSLRVLRAIEQGQDAVTLSRLTQILAYLGLQLFPKPILLAPERNRALPPPRREEVLATLRRVLPILRSKYDVECLGLFGSVARDEATQESDVDLLVSYKTSRETTTRIGGGSDLYLYLRTVLPGREIDLVDESDMKPSVRKSAAEDLVDVEEA